MTAVLGVISLSVEDWFECLDFYHELLGLEVLESDELKGRARLRGADGLVLELRAGGWGSDGVKSARENPASLWFRVESVQRAEYLLDSMGAAVLEESGEHLIALMDPDGNRLYLYDTDSPPAAE